MIASEVENLVVDVEAYCAAAEPVAFPARPMLPRVKIEGVDS